ncbi:11279_t:CDS:2 [Funneliformis geosporum]|uniref:11279_t:CDS:1 n=1 Tax=Funneliformis geosporum TaxID=1117311 RepID=A0A9W4X5D9_9GLOM|nr:11279_t:CDS:2 [Funneliformis geosporum]
MRYTKASPRTDWPITGCKAKLDIQECVMYLSHSMPVCKAP